MYIDPNTGGILFQGLAAAFALLTGIALFFSRQIRAALARLRRSVREALEETSQQPASHELTRGDTDRSRET